MKFVEAVVVPLLYGGCIAAMQSPMLRQSELAPYISPLPFWVLIGRRLSTAWKAFLARVNEGVFPKEMRFYSEMYALSRRAIVYDVVLNHLFIQNVSALVVLLYAYSFRLAASHCPAFPELINYQPKHLLSMPKADQPKNQGAEQPHFEAPSCWELTKEVGGRMVRWRLTASLLAISLDFTAMSLFLKRVGDGGAYGLPLGVRKFMLLKDFLIGMVWHTYNFYLVNEAFDRMGSQH